MAGQKFLVKYTDGRQIEAKISPRAEVEVERKFGIGLTEMQGAIHAEYLYYMAWAGLHYSGKEPLSFDDFLNELDDIDPVEVKKPEDAEVDPFGKAVVQGNLSS